MRSQGLDCPNCGALLLKRITERGVTPADADIEIPFRRTTDFVMCNACMTSYPVRDLAARAPSPPASPDEESNADVITILERLAQRGSR